MDEEVTFDGRTWRPQEDEVDHLGPEDSGVWLILTVGALHVWDLDRGLFTRLPRPDSRAGAMPYDGTTQPIGRVETYPRVGHRLFIWFDEPTNGGPAPVEHYRISSTIRAIHQLLPAHGSAPGP